MIQILAFNIENFDDQPGRSPGPAERAPILRAQLEQLKAHIVRLKVVQGQCRKHRPRGLLALYSLVADIRYEIYVIDSARLAIGREVGRLRNLVFMIGSVINWWRRGEKSSMNMWRSRSISLRQATEDHVMMAAEFELRQSGKRPLVLTH